MGVLRTLIWFAYFWGYLVCYWPALKRGLRDMEEGRQEAVEALVQKRVPQWCTMLLHLAGVTVTVEGKENIPTDGPCVFAGNHRSYYDIPLMLTCLDRAHGLVAKQEIDKIPLVRGWMRLLGCVFVQRDDMRAGVRALNTATEQVKAGHSMVIFPEGTRYKGAEGEIGEFKGGVLRIALKAGAPIVPVAISHSRDIMENHHMLMTPAHVTVRILPPVRVEGLSKEEQRELPEKLRAEIQKNIVV